jgi:hypothetical protein
LQTIKALNSGLYTRGLSFTPQKWFQFLEDVQASWTSVPIRGAKNPDDLINLLRDFAGLSRQRAEREVEGVVQEFERKVRRAIQIEKSAA